MFESRFNLDSRMIREGLTNISFSCMLFQELIHNVSLRYIRLKETLDCQAPSGEK